MNRLAKISNVIIEIEDHGCLTISLIFDYEGGSATQGGGGHNYWDGKDKVHPAFGATIARLVAMYGSLDNVKGSIVEVITEDDRGVRIIGFKPLFTDWKGGPFIFRDFFPSK